MAKDEILNWEANEYIARNKNITWYIWLITIGLLAVGLTIWQEQWTFLALIIVSVVALIVYTSRPPRLLHYSLSSKGLSEGNKLYSFTEFKSFGIIQEDKRFSIVLIPKKRFSLRTVVYFPESQGEKIVDMFGLRLPMEEVKPDLLDRLVRFLRI